MTGDSIGSYWQDEAEALQARLSRYEQVLNDLLADTAYLGNKYYVTENVTMGDLRQIMDHND